MKRTGRVAPPRKLADTRSALERSGYLLAGGYTRLLAHKQTTVKAPTATMIRIARNTLELVHTPLAASVVTLIEGGQRQGGPSGQIRAATRMPPSPVILPMKSSSRLRLCRSCNIVYLRASRRAIGGKSRSVIQPN